MQLQNNPPSMTHHKQEGHHKYRGMRESDPTLSNLNPGNPYREDECPQCLVLKISGTLLWEVSSLGEFEWV